MTRVFIYLSIIVVTISLNIYGIIYWVPDEESSECVTISDNEYGKVNDNYEKSFYKINKDDFLNTISADKKKQLDTMIDKLSIVDKKQIELSMSSENENEGIVDVFRILKRRLSKSEYEKFKEITNEGLDIKGIEGEI